jgi:hypothetical protein
MATVSKLQRLKKKIETNVKDLWDFTAKDIFQINEVPLLSNVYNPRLLIMEYHNKFLYSLLMNSTKF